MAKQKLTVISKNYRKLKTIAQQHKVTVSVVGVIMTLCFVGVLIWLTSFWTIVHYQGERLTAARHEIQAIKAGLQKQLGSSLTDIKEYDSCYHLEQGETPAPLIFQNGVLYCGMNLQGATYNWDSHLPGSVTPWETMVYINGVILNTFSIDGITPTLMNKAPSEPRPGSPITLRNSFTLYDGLMYCNIREDTTYNDIIYPSIKHNFPGQLYFSLNCYQQSSINFYRFLPSGLD